MAPYRWIILEFVCGGFWAIEWRSSPAEWVSVSEGSAVPRDLLVQHGHLLRVPEGPVSVPSGCAGCGRPAPRTLSLKPGGRVLLLPACELCATEHSRFQSRRFGLSLGGLLIGCSAALGLPLADRAVADLTSLWEQLRVTLPYLAAVALVPLPWLIAGVARPEVPAPLSSDAEGLRVADQTWAREFCRLNQVESVLSPSRVRRPASLLWVTLVTAALALAAHMGLRSELWVLNLSGRPGDLLVDGERVLVDLPSTAAESAGAGVRLSLVAGNHDLALGGSKPDIDVSVSLRPGVPHLLALAAKQECFWLETAGYGRAASPLRRTVLVGEPAFWSLTEPIDVWFAPLPEPASVRLSTGGELTALRRAPCLEAPAEVQARAR